MIQKNGGDPRNHAHGNVNLVFSRKDIHSGNIQEHLRRINHEFTDGFAFLKQYPRSVTVFGSSLIKSDNQNYRLAEEFGRRVVQKLSYAIITGGGSGIMEAANKGAYEAGGISIGLNISLPHEHSINPFVTHSLKFSYFFSRKVIMTFAAEAYVFFPGGYGTFDELFNILMLIQTGKMPRVPVVLFDSIFWKAFLVFAKETMCEKYHTIDSSNLDLFHITDSLEETIDMVGVAPVSEWWRGIN